jgi:hypothetical protein
MLQACVCQQRGSTCSSLPSSNDGSRAIFIGKVEEVYPSGFAAYTAAIRSLPRDRKWTQVDAYREAYLSIWKGKISPEDEARLRDAKTFAQLQPFKGATSWYPIRVRLSVQERFFNALDPLIDLVVESGGDCDTAFEKNETYLVYATGNGAVWGVGACSRTTRLEGAVDDLNLLRAWSDAGRRLPMMYGRVTTRPGGSPRPRLELLLTSPAGSNRKSLTDANGIFAFGGLESARYNLEVNTRDWQLVYSDIGERKSAFQIGLPATRELCQQEDLVVERSEQ